jgi:hypothetical protein
VDTKAGSDHLKFRERLEKLTLNSTYAAEYRSLLKTYGDPEAALLALWAAHGANASKDWPWPRTGTFRIIPQGSMRKKSLSDEEKEKGISGGPFWVPFEKGDQSQELEEEEGGRTSRIGAAWSRENPLVIDWSTAAVALLRRRAIAKGAQSPRLQNEQLWFHAGVTWNRVASYLRARQIPEHAIFGSEAPLLRPLQWVKWLSPLSLLSLLNADTLDFMLRTFLGSRMHVEVGDVRRLVVPVLTPAQKQTLEQIAKRALAAKQSADAGKDGEPLTEIEKELSAYTRDLYRIPRTARLWVVR